ncbi:MAG: DUF5056 domain-containing protein [Prevotella sp.]|jgi:hypothetical protein
MNTNDIHKSDDQLLNQFFAEQRQDIVDDGFTERVMNNLPRRRRTFLLWIGAAAVLCIGTAVVVARNIDTIWQWILLGARHLLEGITSALSFLFTLDLSSINLHTPLTILVALITLFVVGLYNLATDDNL